MQIFLHKIQADFPISGDAGRIDFDFVNIYAFPFTMSAINPAVPGGTSVS